MILTVEVLLEHLHIFLLPVEVVHHPPHLFKALHLYDGGEVGEDGEEPSRLDLELGFEPDTTGQEWVVLRLS